MLKANYPEKEMANGWPWLGRLLAKVVGMRGSQ